MERLIAKNVVVGAGAVGRATAHHLARRGEAVVLVERFGLGHARGSSLGAALSIRHSHADPVYAPLMPDAFRAWADLEADAGALAAASAPEAEIESARRGPDTRILTETPIRRVDLDGERPTLVADDLAIAAERLILAAGPWIGRLVPELAATHRPTRQQVLYLRPPNPGPFQPGRVPAFIHMGASPDEAFYGMPEFLAPGVKVARHGGPETVPDEPATVGEDHIALARDFLRGHPPILADAEVVATETRLYTVAPDERFLVDVHPERPDVFAASPCSGHGFKFSILVGRALAEMATGADIDPRFDAWKRTP